MDDQKACPSYWTWKSRQSVQASCAVRGDPLTLGSDAEQLVGPWSVNHHCKCQEIIDRKCTEKEKIFCVSPLTDLLVREVRSGVA